jgi:hypothetical protein
MDDDATDQEASLRSQGLTPNAYVLEGLAGAADRLDHSRLTKDECGMSVATYEALLWVMVVDDRLRRSGGPYVSHRNKHRYGRSLPGMRFAWNALKHSELDAIIDTTPGAAFPIQFPVTWFEMRWKPTSMIPLFGDEWKSQRENYEANLATKPVRLTLGGVIDFIRREANQRGYQRRGLPASQLPPGIIPRESQLETR